MKYFDKLPLITYDGQSSRNILSRAQLTPETRSNAAVFYPYTMDSSDRADTLSHMYYDNSDYMWLIWMANNVIDPYHDMPLSEDDLNSFMVKKYGSVTEAQQQIVYWRNDWAVDDTILTPSQYDALLVYYDENTGVTINRKKYYDPVLDIYFSVSGYKRKQADWIANTNKVATFAISNVIGTIQVGERVSVNTNNYAWVTNVTQDTITVQHVTGAFAVDDSFTGSMSGATFTVASTPYVVTTIPDEEIFYWTPITAYQYEQERNDKKKELVLIDARYKQIVSDEITRVMKR